MRRAEEPNAPTATGTIWIRSELVKILFDTGATHSFIATACVDRLHLICSIGIPFVVGLPDGSKVSEEKEILQCPIRIGDQDWLTNFIVMALPNDDVILGMD